MWKEYEGYVIYHQGLLNDWNNHQSWYHIRDPLAPNIRSFESGQRSQRHQEVTINQKNFWYNQVNGDSTNTLTWKADNQEAALILNNPWECTTISCCGAGAQQHKWSFLRHHHRIIDCLDTTQRWKSCWVKCLTCSAEFCDNLLVEADFFIILGA